MRQKAEPNITARDLVLMSSMENIYARVLKTWKSAGLSLVTALHPAEIELRLDAAGLVVASDFVELYATAGGMTDAEWDSNLWSCWNLEKVLQETRGYEREGVLFADWCINSHFHLVRRETAGRSSVWVDFFSDDEPQMVSDSLVDFLERYLAKDETTHVYFDIPESRSIDGIP